MAKEIERKFLVKDDSFMPMATRARRMAQGYLSTNPTVRVRVIADRDLKAGISSPQQAFITVKGPNRGIVRDEWEYAVPVDDARGMMDLCSKVVEKTRYIVPYCGHTWEVDIFEGRLSGMALAEIELPDASADFDIPPFIGDEVTGIPRYYNSNM